MEEGYRLFDIKRKLIMFTVELSNLLNISQPTRSQFIKERPLPPTELDGSDLLISGNNIFIKDGKYLLGTASGG